MKSKNIDTVLENQSLKAEFSMRNLDLSQVWQPTPDDLELENRQLLHLLDWVKKYQECPNRKKMEAEGYLFPPLSFDIEPDSDWLRFERWIAGKSIQAKLKDLLSKSYMAKNPENLTDNEISEELQQLCDALAKLHFAVDFQDELPLRLVYEQLYEMLEDKFDLIADGWWHLDSCTGYCPDCVRRPWCEQGNGSCWNEDEAAGYMVVPEAVKRFVSPSPVSLEILRVCQEQENREHEQFMKEHAGENNIF